MCGLTKKLNKLFNCNWQLILCCIATTIVPTVSKAEILVRVVDVGPGLCVIASDKKNNKYFLYDAGHWNNRYCAEAVRDSVGNNDISLVVISHPDSDHLGNLKEILSRNTADIIVHTGYERTRVKTWREANHAISEASKEGSSVINLSSFQLSSVPTQHLGDMSVEFLYGMGDWDSELGSLSENHRRNAISIVVKLSAYGKSILFSGDTVGRHDGDPDDKCAYAERDITSKTDYNLRSDILIAPHHGADNGSSKCFISKVKPEVVIFSSGHRYQHPRLATVDRIKAAIPIENHNIYRTDRGDDEGSNEWDYLRIEGCKDTTGDDDVIIALSETEGSSVSYLDSDNICSEYF